MPVYERTGGEDGYVSLEVQPDIAYDTEATIEEAARLHDMIDRPNLFVKIPATLQGLGHRGDDLPRQVHKRHPHLLLSATARWSVPHPGRQEARRERGDPSDVRSVASFFVSRIDSEADKRLEELGADDLKGRLAIANAKIAYQIYKQVFGGPGGGPSRKEAPTGSVSCGLRPRPRTPITPTPSTWTTSSGPRR